MSGESKEFRGLIGDTMPDFKLDSTHGALSLYEAFGTSWGILFSHPADFTPICTTELGMAQEYMPEFSKRNVKIAGLSCQDAQSHTKWLDDIAAYTVEKRGKAFRPAYPIFADTDRKVAQALGMLNKAHVDAAGIPLPARKVFVLNPSRKIVLTLTYPAATGRNFDEILRILDSVQLTAYKKLATPANWKSGEDCVLLPSVKGEEAKAYDPQEVKLPSGKPYLRTAKCPASWPKGASSS